MRSVPHAHRAEPQPAMLLLALPLILYLAVALFWLQNDQYVITGDEPHYLVIAESLIHDRDLFVANNYAGDTPITRAYNPAHTVPLGARGHAENGYSIHSPGLPVLLALPYALGGVFGAKLALAALHGLLALLCYGILRSILGSPAWALLLAFVVTAALPFLTASNQVYPDLPAGLAILAALTWITGWRRRCPGPAELPGAAALISLLPWLHLRLLAPALVLVLFGALVVWRQLELRAAWRRWLPAVLLVAANLALLAGYNLAAFGRLSGPYNAQGVRLDLHTAAMIALGLHWDSLHGLFVGHPLLLLALPGVIPLLRRDRALAVVLGLLWLAIILPVSLHPNWYGGLSLSGRFGWAAAGLWVVPFAAACRALVEHRPRVLLVLCLGSMLYQGGLPAVYLAYEAALYNPGVELPAWTAPALLARLFNWSLRTQFMLPAFRDFQSYLLHPANYLVLLMSTALVATGLAGRRRWRLVPVALWLAVLAAGLVVVLASRQLPDTWLRPATWTASELPGRSGLVVGSARVADGDAPGLLIYGPYLTLPRGRYRIELAYESSDPRASPGRWDVVFRDGGRVLVAGALPPSAENGGVLVQTIDVVTPIRTNIQFEVRVRYTGPGRLAVQRLTVVPLGPAE